MLPGITIGRGVTVGAGSVVTRDIPPFHCVAGNPARIIRRIEFNSLDDVLRYNSEVPNADQASASEEVGPS